MTVRVLRNTSALLENGTFPGEAAPAIIEAKGLINALINETQGKLQSLAKNAGKIVAVPDPASGVVPNHPDVTPAADA